MSFSKTPYREGYVGPDSEHLLDVATTPEDRRLAAAFVRRTCPEDWVALLDMLGLEAA